MTAVVPDRGQGAVRATAICWLPPGATMGRVARGRSSWLILAWAPRARLILSG